jgi:hypothetical protein
MAERKSLLKRAPERPELERLLVSVLSKGITEEQLQEQRISFAYGNAPERSGITKDSARKAARSIKLGHLKD